MSVFDQYVIAAGEIYWPDRLPQCYLQEGFAYSPVKATVDSKMGAGLGKRRRHFTHAPWLLRGVLIINDKQRYLLDKFIKDTLDNGALPFLKSDPILPRRLFRWRFEAPLAYTPRHGNNWQVTLRLSRLPMAVEYEDNGLVDAAGRHLMDDFIHWLGDDI